MKNLLLVWVLFFVGCTYYELADSRANNSLIGESEQEQEAIPVFPEIDLIVDEDISANGWKNFISNVVEFQYQEGWYPELEIFTDSDRSWRITVRNQERKPLLDSGFSGELVLPELDDFICWRIDRFPWQKDFSWPIFFADKFDGIIESYEYTQIPFQAETEAVRPVLLQGAISGSKRIFVRTYNAVYDISFFHGADAGQWPEVEFSRFLSFFIF